MAILKTKIDEPGIDTKRLWDKVHLSERCSLTITLKQMIPDFDPFKPVEE